MTGEFACKTVVRPYSNANRSIVEIELVAEEGTSETLETTANHPFWVRERGFVEAGQLKPGDQIYNSKGGWLKVRRAAWTTGRTTVYNFGVRDFRSYFVGQSGAWVHNCFSSRNAAFRAAKRDAKVPVTQQPSEVRRVRMTGRGGSAVKDDGGNVVRTREYYFTNRNNEEIVIQDHIHGHPRFGEDNLGSHFNVRPGGRKEKKRTGNVEGTLDHYKWEAE
mgnify:CR=1 FL=1